MAKTTVDLTDIAKEILKVLQPRLGLKNALSAGLVILNKLSREAQFHACDEAKGIDDTPLIIYTQETKELDEKRFEKIANRLVRSALKRAEKQKQKAHRSGVKSH